MKTLELTRINIEDEYEGIVSQDLYSDDKDVNIYYSVCNLCECPEDATINRDLFSAESFVDTLKLGMELANKGYTDIKVNKLTKERWER